MPFSTQMGYIHFPMNTTVSHSTFFGGPPLKLNIPFEKSKDNVNGEEAKSSEVLIIAALAFSSDLAQFKTFLKIWFTLRLNYSSRATS